MIVASLLAALAQSGHVSPPPPVPPLPIADATPTFGYEFVAPRLRALTCGGETVVAKTQDLPIPTVVHPYGQEPVNDVEVGFDIGAAGRPHDIRVLERERAGWADVADIVPALASWTFAPGAPQRGCIARFSIAHMPVGLTPPADAIRYLALRYGSTPADRAVFDRTVPADSTCFRPRFPAVRLRAFPAFDRIPQPEGTTSFSLIGFDVNRRGRPIHVHVAASGGNAALDAASVKAVRRSRFEPGARQGCVYPYRRRPAPPLPAPPMPNEALYPSDPQTCDGLTADWATPPRLQYPGNFQRRGIEGWAVVRFDVAPWGEIGNVSVVTAEPAAAFGDAAIGVLRAARKPPSTRGYSGCTQRVRFKMEGPLQPNGGDFNE